MSVGKDDLRIGACYTSRVLGCVREVVDMDANWVMWQTVPSIYAAPYEEGFSHRSVFARLSDYEAQPQDFQRSVL